MPNVVFCNWYTCKYNVDEVCKKTTILLETLEKEGSEVLICKSFESASDIRRPLDSRSMICPECGYRMIPDSGCSFCPNCGYSPCK